jgi:hypothetical protein
LAVYVYIVVVVQIKKKNGQAITGEAEREMNTS